MKNMLRRTSMYALALCSLAQFPATSTAQQAAATELRPLALRGVYFVPNHGQWNDTDVKYGFSSRGLDVACRESSLTMHMARENESTSRAGASTSRACEEAVLDVGRDAPLAHTRGSSGESADIQSLTLTITFPGSNDVLPRGSKPQDAKFNYFVGGNGRAVRSGVPSFAGVVYEDLYDGVDLHVMGSGGGVLKYEFHVAPGADCSQIRIAYDGIDSLCIDDAGDLRINTSFGALSDAAPLVWQESDVRRTISSRFELIDPRSYRIALDGPVDPSRELIIDPEVDWMTYLGGTGIDVGYRLAIDGGGDAFVAGHTYSTDFEGRLNEHHGGHALDLFVVKIDSTGTLQWMTYLGGSAYDEDFGIAVDGDGNALLTGNTVSTDFEGRLNEHHGGTDDAFVARISPAGVVEWMTYLGGSATDYGFGITVDAAGDAFVAGRSRSTDFEARTNSHHGGVHDAVAIKVSSAGQVQWATYLGGSGVEAAVGIDLDADGYSLLIGYTNSSDFEGQNNSNHGGQSDAFVAKVSSAGAIQWATYLGGTAREEGYDIAVNAAGDSFVAAFTDSADFEGRNNAYQFEDAAVARVSAAGTLQWMTYLGGSGDDGAIGIAIDAAGDAIVAGYTYSPDFAGRTNDLSGMQDAFVSKVSASGLLDWATYFGGAGNEDAVGLSLDGVGGAFISGSTESSDFEGRTNEYHGGRDGFVARVDIAEGIQLSADGTCPGGGGIQVSWSGASGGGQIALLFAVNTGSFPIPSGNPCAGTQLGLGSNQIQIAYQGSAGANGARTVNSTAGPGACGGYLQLLDVATCSTSNVVRIE